MKFRFEKLTQKNRPPYIHDCTDCTGWWTLKDYGFANWTMARYLLRKRLT